MCPVLEAKDITLESPRNQFTKKESSRSTVTFITHLHKRWICRCGKPCGSSKSRRPLVSFLERGRKLVLTKQQKIRASLVLIFLSVSLVVASNQPSLRVSSAPVADRINVAASENGGTAAASSTDDNYTPDAVNDGDRKGLNLTTGGGWRDDTPNSFPDWVEVEFKDVSGIDEVSVFTQQDTWWSPVEPTETMVFFNNGITSFEVQYWTGSSWLTIPGVTTTNNNKVWRKFTFPRVTTDKIRVLIYGAKLPSSTVVEIEAFGVPESAPDPNPTPTASPVPLGTVDAALAAHDIYFDQDNNVGFGTLNPIFNDDGTTGAFVGRFVAIDGRLTGAAAYLGLGGNVPNPNDRVGVLNFYNIAMGGVDNRTAAIYSFNGPQLGQGVLEFATSPNFIGPVRRMQIAPTGEVGINHLASTGNTLTVMGKSTGATTKALSVVDGADHPTLTVRDDGQVTIGRPGQGIVLRSPNGQICKKLVINDNGELVVQSMPACP